MAGNVAPLASIGVPVYNGERFLTRTLDSLLGQTETDFELMIADNASTDATQSICEDYARRDPRVRYVRHEANRGAYFNWNFVARNARGRYFKWASANDYCAPTMLARCVEALESDAGIVLCHGRTCIVDEADKEQRLYERDIEVLDPRPSVRFKRVCSELALNNAQSGVIRVAALRRTGLDRPYPAGDLVLMAELALIGGFRLLPEVLLYRRLGPQTTTRNLSLAEARHFLDPTNRATRDANVWRRHLDYLATVIKARIAPREKLICLLHALRHANWDRAQLWRELVGPTRHEADAN